jgi:hypothetical protein
MGYGAKWPVLTQSSRTDLQAGLASLVQVRTRHVHMIAL